MAVYRLESSGVMISKMYRDLKLDDANWENDALEWIGEALDHIGWVGYTFEEKEAILEIDENGRSLLPTDMAIINQVYYSPSAPFSSGNKYVMKRDNSTLFAGIHSYQSLTPLQTNYKIQGGYIHVGDNMDDVGGIAIAYKAFPLDDNGHPMIPSDQSFKDAIFWYILKTMMLGGWQHPNPEITFSFAETRWLKYCDQARIGAKMPDVDDLEMIGKSWVRMVDVTNRHSVFFREEIRDTSHPYGNAHLLDKIKPY